MNKSDGNVFFDDFAVSISQGNIIEENRYYSFGLKIAAISSRKYNDSHDGKINNPFEFNGKEMLDDDADLNWYDYGFRSYDPQIGRFMQLDPLTDKYPFLTPYQFASDDPITNIDIDGLEGEKAVERAKDFAYGYGAAAKFTDEMVIHVAVRATGTAKNGHKLYKILRVSGYIVKASAFSDDLVKSGSTKPISGRDQTYSYGIASQREKMERMASSGGTLPYVSNPYWRFIQAFNHWVGLDNKGSHQEDGFVLTGGSGTTAEFFDRADNISGVIDIGLLLHYASGLSLEMKELLWKTADKRLLVKIIKFTEGVRTSTETIDFYKSVKEDVEKTLDEKEGNKYQKFCTTCGRTFVSSKPGDTSRIERGSPRLKTIKGRVDTINVDSPEHPQIKSAN